MSLLLLLLSAGQHHHFFVQIHGLSQDEHSAESVNIATPAIVFSGLSFMLEMWTVTNSFPDNISHQKAHRRCYGI
jgi:hypothetical protein